MSVLKFKIFDHPVFENVNFGKIKNIWVALKILLKLKLFDQPARGKGKIWINQ